MTEQKIQSFQKQKFSAGTGTKSRFQSDIVFIIKAQLNVVIEPGTPQPDPKCTELPQVSLAY